MSIWLGILAAGPAMASPAYYSDVPVGADHWANLGVTRDWAAPALTLEMERQRLVRMVALRDEVRQLKAADGGTLSPENRTYLNRKARKLLAR